MAASSPRRPRTLSESSNNAMIRRRDKRRHVSSQSIDLRDPYSLIALAIRVDEANALATSSVEGFRHENSQGSNLRGGLEILQVPLETGSLYNQKAFSKALQTLEQHTTVPYPTKKAPESPVRRRTRSQPSSSSTPTDKNESKNTQDSNDSFEALTPIVLSGLVAAMQERSGEQEDQEGPSAVELVAYCRSMRRAALTRVRAQNHRRKVQRHCTPFVLLSLILVMALWSASRARSLILEYEFVIADKDDSGNTTNSRLCNTPACRHASAKLWEFTSPSHPIALVPADCTVQDCSVGNEPSLLSGGREPPSYAIQTPIRPAYLTLAELDQYPRHPPRRSSPKVWPRAARRSSQDPVVQSPLQWLGETPVNRLVRETIDKYHSSTKVLDCGCGIGGTLYALLNTQGYGPTPSQMQTTKTKAQSQTNFNYHGIALSAPEIYQAKRLVKLHQLNTTESIHFQQQDFDQPFDQKYTTIIAIESLSYSPNLRHTLHNLAKSLPHKGLMIIVDDVVAPWTPKKRVEELRMATGKPPLRTHQEWKNIFRSASLKIETVRDLGLEMDLDEWVRGDAIATTAAGTMTDSGNTLFGLLGDLRYWVAQRFIQQWIAWFGEGSTIERRASLRMIQIFQDVVERRRAQASRRTGYQRADLSYYFHILVKQ